MRVANIVGVAVVLRVDELAIAERVTTRGCPLSLTNNNP